MQPFAKKMRFFLARILFIAHQRSMHVFLEGTFNARHDKKFGKLIYCREIAREKLFGIVVESKSWGWQFKSIAFDASFIVSVAAAKMPCKA